ncbi:MAG: AmpG family muropeptide MFS transporter [Magnetococcales bacterium]|nr:AmpG family muropeptide MFS transporter [Magnetococcales bacterium]MBF0437608.1 AmpG family muropeptide MFS transporter [Magnetococcales bacterium]
MGLLQWRLQHSLAVYLEPRVLVILLLGFSSGLPLALTLGTLSLWLAEVGVSKTSIALFALAGMPYTFKFLWSPLVDRMPVPFLTRYLGQRRGWGVFTQFFLMVCIIGLGGSNPVSDPFYTAMFAFFVAFWSATQDIVIDAYRVESLEERQYGTGAAMSVLGYRLGMLVSGAGTLYLATFWGWFIAYAIMASLMGVGMLVMLMNPEPKRAVDPDLLEQEVALRTRLLEQSGQVGWRGRVVDWVSGAVVAPFVEFMGRQGWQMTLLFILLYKFGDALAGSMSGPFYIEMGFSKIEIANVTKLFGLVAVLLGGIIGGVLTERLGIMKSLLYCGILQMVSNLMFVLLAQVGHSMEMLIVTIALENIASGMGTSAFVAYLSKLCNVAYTATQYALLSSFMAFGRNLMVSSGGWLADQMSWSTFFLVTTLAALPGLFFLLFMSKRFHAS